jgi:hypothetical protein
MRCKTLKASNDKLGKLLDYYAGLADDRERPDRHSRGPVDYYRVKIVVDCLLDPLVLRELLDGLSRSRPIRCASGYSPASWARQFPATTGRQPQATSLGSPLRTSAAMPLNFAARPGELSPRRRRPPRTVVRGRARR